MTFLKHQHVKCLIPLSHDILVGTAVPTSHRFIA